MQTRQIALLRPDQILAEMARSPLVYLPVGPLGGTAAPAPGDRALNARRCPARCRASAVVLPTCYFGTERGRPELLYWLSDRASGWWGWISRLTACPAYASEGLCPGHREQTPGREDGVQADWSSPATPPRTRSRADRLAAEFSAAEPAKVLVAPSRGAEV
jgi:hypothetical protein